MDDALTTATHLATDCMGPAFERRAHTDMVGRLLAGMMAGSLGDRVAVVLPPECGKSTTAAVWGPFWWLCQRPEQKLAVVSYSHTVAAMRGRSVLDLVGWFGARNGIGPVVSPRAPSLWALASGGLLRTVGVGAQMSGTVTGLMVVDDPHRGPEDLQTGARRADVLDWYLSVPSARMAPGSAQLLVTSRRHPEDLLGQLVARQGTVEHGGRWTVVRMAALALPGDPLGRQVGEPLPHPLIPAGDRAAALEYWHSKRAMCSDEDWQTLYQGNPGRAGVGE